MATQTARINYAPAFIKIENGFYQGNTFLMVFTLKDSTTGNPIDVGGATAKMRLVKKSDNSTVIDLPGAGGSITFPAPTSSGKIRIEVLDTTTATWPVGCDIIGDLELTINSAVRTFAVFEFYVTKPITPA
jgi:hypothetical protein